MQSIGNLAQHFLLRQQTTNLKTELIQLSQEVASGQTSDKAKFLDGDFSELADLERSQRRLETYSLIAGEAELTLDTAGATLSTLEKLSSNLASQLPQALETGTHIAGAAIAEEGLHAFQTAVSALNTSVAGKSIFGGTAVDQPALASAEDILNAIRVSLEGTATPADFVQGVDDWFNLPGGGFETMAYLGAATSSEPIQVSDDTSIGFDLKADQAGIRNALRDLAVIALSTDPILGFSDDMQKQVFEEKLPDVMGSRDTLIGMQAQLGVSQAYLETAITSNEAARLATETALSDLLSVEPYETATRLENVTTQMEGIYLVTARMNQLSLMDYFS